VKGIVQVQRIGAVIELDASCNECVDARLKGTPMANLSEAEDIRALLRSVESREQELSHGCRAELSIAPEDLGRVCRAELAGRQEGGNDGAARQQSRVPQILASILNPTQDKKLISGAGDTSL
jgi:hypothetical protein